jgi:hypothetical protein
MNALHAALWTLAFSTVVVGLISVHRQNTHHMREQIQRFEARWHQLEARYET